MADFSADQLSGKETFVYYNEIGMVMPYITDNFRQSDGELLRRNIYICTNFNIGEPQLIDSRLEEMSSHNYAYQYPPRIKYDFDDLDITKPNQEVFLDGRKYLEADYQKPYQSKLKPWQTLSPDYASLVAEAEEATLQFRLTVLPPRIEELKAMEATIQQIVNEVISLSDRQSFTALSPTEQNDRVALIQQKQTTIEQLANKLAYKSRHLYDGLTASAYDRERESPHYFYEKHFVMNFEFDHLVYTGWKIYRVTDIYKQGLTAQSKSEANNFALWHKSQLHLRGRVKYGYFPNIGKLYYGVLRIDPQDIANELDELREEIFISWKKYLDDIAIANKKAIKKAKAKPIDPLDPDSPLIGNNLDTSTVSQQKPSTSQFYSNFASIRFQKSTLDSSVFVLSILTLYYQHRMDFNNQIWRFFDSSTISVSSPERSVKYVYYPDDTPFPLYYSVRKIRGFKVGFEVNETVDGVTNTYIEWIDPLSPDLHKMKSRVLVIEATDLRTTFYQYIRADLASLPTAATYQDVELNLSLRYPSDFPIVDIDYHHEAIGFTVIDPPDTDNDVASYPDMFPKSAQGVFPQEVENLLPDPNNISESINYQAQQVFRVDTDQYSPVEPEY